jgi:hypothetical protein
VSGHLPAHAADQCDLRRPLHLLASDRVRRAADGRGRGRSNGPLPRTSSSVRFREVNGSKWAMTTSPSAGNRRTAVGPTNSSPPVISTLRDEVDGTRAPSPSLAFFHQSTWRCEPVVG